MDGQGYDSINILVWSQLTYTLGVISGVHVEARITGTQETANCVRTHLLARVQHGRRTLINV